MYIHTSRHASAVEYMWWYVSCDFTRDRSRKSRAIPEGIWSLHSVHHTLLIAYRPWCCRFRIVSDWAQASFRTVAEPVVAQHNYITMQRIVFPMRDDWAHELPLFSNSALAGGTWGACEGISTQGRVNVNQKETQRRKVRSKKQRKQWSPICGNWMLFGFSDLWINWSNEFDLMKSIRLMPRHSCLQRARVM